MFNSPILARNQLLHVVKFNSVLAEAYTEDVPIEWFVKAYADDVTKPVVIPVFRRLIEAVNLETATKKDNFDLTLPSSMRVKYVDTTPLTFFLVQQLIDLSKKYTDLGEGGANSFADNIMRDCISRHPSGNSYWESLFVEAEDSARLFVQKEGVKGFFKEDLEEAHYNQAVAKVIRALYVMEAMTPLVAQNEFQRNKSNSDETWLNIMQPYYDFGSRVVQLTERHQNHSLKASDGASS